ncbi:hypothetical protein [Amycolatopsis sp.]|uniref:hypothetical protein n=1 Tax=Amycolatopsis sp. TaxID=37632 RepID=UPI002C3F7045|nr:hypothetical protein [Amycolatopsis sp.]HVV11574.1 hypothetical protein [Amycolatopsis sp.]
MSKATWYLGPLGDLRALTCPEPGIKDTVVRFGGVHQGLSGARTVDVTGHRSELSFDWKYMEKAEWKWLKALHTRHIPGPFRLIKPTGVNRLSLQASSCYPLPTTNGLGVYNTVSNVEWALDWPADADPGYRSLRLSSFAASQILRWDFSGQTPVFPGETITASLYAKTETAGQTFSLTVDYYDRTGAQTSSAPWVSCTPTTDWQRFNVTTTVPEGTASVVFALITGDFVGPVRIAAAQLESGSAPTDWEQGGSAPTVHIDQLETSSPLFPLTDCSMTLLEA